MLIRPAVLTDLNALVSLENACFSSDRLSRRSFRHWLTTETEHRLLLVAEINQHCVGYVLFLYHPGTRLARVYSLAVDPELRGQGIAKTLLQAGEQAARDNGRFYLRLEVSVENSAAIALYRSLGFQQFGFYRDYYQDHKDALRFQKRIRRYSDQPQHRSLPWLKQTTPFTCGPAALMMAMRALDTTYRPSRDEEINLWREATTIFMTSGHGGCHPTGLALAAQRRGFAVEVWVNQQGPLFIDSVRNEDKKQIIDLVDKGFKRDAQRQNIPIHYSNVTLSDLTTAFESGGIPLILISTFAMDGKKAPHWVAMSGFDQDCLYMHDPDPDERLQSDLDCQFVPIAREDFERMSCFGKNRLRTAVVLRHALKPAEVGAPDGATA